MRAERARECAPGQLGSETIERFGEVEPFADMSWLPGEAERAPIDVVPVAAEDLAAGTFAIHLRDPLDRWACFGQEHVELCQRARLMPGKRVREGRVNMFVQVILKIARRGDRAQCGNVRVEIDRLGQPQELRHVLVGAITTVA